MKIHLLACALMLSVTSCALVPDTTDLQYNSITNLVPIPGASRVRVNVAVNDLRGGRPDQIGVKKNGYGMEMAPILTSRPVSDLVRDAVSQELRKEGFDTAPGSVAALVDVVKFFNDFKMGFFSADAASEVILSVQVRNAAGQITYSRSLTGDNSTGGVFIASGSNAKLSLEASLSNAIAKLIADRAFTAALLAGSAGAIQIAPPPPQS